MTHRRTALACALVAVAALAGCGGGSGAVVENANFSGAQRLDPQSHHYLAAWSGARSRGSIPGGCKGIPNLLEPARPVRRQGLPPSGDP